MEFSGDCQGISGHFRTFGDSVGTQLSQIGPVYAIGCVGADFFIGSNGEAYECELRSGFTRDRAHGGKTFPLVAKTPLKRRVRHNRAARISHETAAALLHYDGLGRQSLSGKVA